MEPMIIVVIVGGLLVLTFILIYNSLIAKKNDVNNAQAGLDAQLKQRYDLIPNLVSTVKNYMTHEKDLLSKIVELRAQALSSTVNESKQSLNQEISRSLGTIVMQAEQYPDLKSNTNFQELQKTLYDIEQNIAAARRYFNAAVTEYNNALEMFPSSMIASVLGYKAKEVFNIPELERKNINVSDLFKE